MKKKMVETHKLMKANNRYSRIDTKRVKYSKEEKNVKGMLH